MVKLNVNVFKPILHTTKDILLLALSTIGYAYIRDFICWSGAPFPSWFQSFIGDGFVLIGLILSMVCFALIFTLNNRYINQRKRIIIISIAALILSVVVVAYQWIMTGECLFDCGTQFFNILTLYIVTRICFMDSEKV